MDFDHFIAAHSQWKRQLRNYIEKADGCLQASEVGRDNRCELGKWICGEGSIYSALPEFQAICSEHARFHKAAADIVRSVDAGQNLTEETALGSGSDFAVSSAALVRDLAALRNRIANDRVLTAS